MEPVDQALLTEIKKLNKHISRLSSRLSFSASLLRGILSGLGSVLGATLVVGLIVYLLRNVDVVPLIGDWLADIFSHVLNRLPQP